VALKHHKGSNLKLGIHLSTLTGGRELYHSMGCIVEKFREKSLGKAKEKNSSLLSGTWVKIPKFRHKIGVWS